MTKHPETATFGEFARIADFKRPYITQLNKEGRLVLDGKGRVKVAESLERIEATRDPSKAGVRRRHAAKRATSAPTEPKGRGNAQAEPADDAEEGADDTPPSIPSTPEERNWAQARAKREHFNALKAEDEWRKINGELMEAADVTAAVSKAATEIRARLERLPSVLAPQLAAETDETRIRSLLADYIEEAQRDLERGLRGVAKGKGE